MDQRTYADVVLGSQVRVERPLEQIDEQLRQRIQYLFSRGSYVIVKAFKDGHTFFGSVYITGIVDSIDGNRIIVKLDCLPLREILNPRMEVLEWKYVRCDVRDVFSYTLVLHLSKHIYGLQEKELAVTTTKAFLDNRELPRKCRYGFRCCSQSSEHCSTFIHDNGRRWSKIIGQR